MSLITLPTRGALDLGPALTDERAPTANELSAVHVERVKDRLIEIATDLGIDTTPAAGSVKARLDDLEVTEGPKWNLLAVIAPGVSDDGAAGYARGSIWVDNFGKQIYVATDVGTGAAVWVKWAKPSALTPAAVAAAGVTGTSLDFAREDHAHAEYHAFRAVTASASIAATDRVINADPTAGNVTLTLPAPASVPAGCMILVKKTTTGINTISLARAALEQIEGTAATYLLPGSDGTDRPAWAVYTDGTNWHVA